MKIAYFLLDGVPRLDNASARNVRALRWLGMRHEVTLFPVYRDQSACVAAADAAADLRERVSPRVTLGSAMVAPPVRGWTQRIYDVKTVKLLGSELLAATVGFDWVWFCYPPLVADRGLLSELRARSTRVSWDWDCLSLLHARAARHGGITLGAAAAAAHTVASLHYERRYLRRLDMLTVPAIADANWLRRTTGRDVGFLRAAVDLSSFANARSARPDESVALFIGSAWGPNVHGIRWVLRNVWPEVARQLPEARLRIVGRGMTPELLGPLPCNAELVGEVADVTIELGRAQAVLSPIFYGAGIPTKLLEAGASARATLTTAYCDRALGGSGFHVSDDAQSWQKDLVRLLGDPALARESGERGYRAIARNWSVEEWEGDMARVEAAMCS